MSGCWRCLPRNCNIEPNSGSGCNETVTFGRTQPLIPLRPMSQIHDQTEVSDIIARVRTVPDEAVLIQQADLSSHALAEGHGDHAKVADAIETASCLKASPVQIDE